MKPKFIELTESYGNDETSPVIVNPEHILYICKGIKDSTVLQLPDKNTIRVTETIEQILKKIGEHNE
tara:strand:+ start:9533 stop:9733 length:201 start_codon:yes stop_codon:yes gene_type:complete